MHSRAQHLFLVRHGQTVLNAQDRLRGLADPELDATGIQQAARVAAALADHDIAAVYSSPLLRATATAETIAARLGVASATDERVNDRDYGPWTGHRRTEVVARFGAVDAAPGVEPAAAVTARARPALDTLLDAHPGLAVVVVSHDAVIGPLLTAIDPSVVAHTPTGSWSEPVRTAGVWTVASRGRLP